VHADRALDHPLGPGRIVIRPLGLAGVNRIRIKDSEVGGIARPNQPSALDAVNRGHLEAQLVHGTLQAQYVSFTHPKSEQRGGVAEVRAEQHMRAGVRSADKHVGALHDLTHRLGISAGVRVPKNCLQIFFQGQIKESIQAIPPAHRGHLGDGFADVLLVLGPGGLLDSHDIQIAVKTRRTRVSEVCAQFLPRRAIRERLFARRFVREHQTFPGGKLVKKLGGLEIEMSDQRHGVAQTVGAVSLLKRRGRMIELFFPLFGPIGSMDNREADHGPTGAPRPLVVKVEVLGRVLSQRRLNYARIELAEGFAQGKKFFDVGHAARHRLAVLAHMPLVAVGRKPECSGLHALAH
jgi:hypothetical protein